MADQRVSYFRDNPVAHALRRHVQQVKRQKKYGYKHLAKDLDVSTCLIERLSRGQLPSMGTVSILHSNKVLSSDDVINYVIFYAANVTRKQS